LLHTLQELDAFRRPERFEQFLLACQADALGRRGRESQPYPQANIFRKALLATREVDPRQLLERGFQGQKMAAELERARIAAIAKTLKKYNKALPSTRR
jgi:tRNA nucleotidyltransferase (CCA-adding enzyme)